MPQDRRLVTQSPVVDFSINLDVGELSRGHGGHREAITADVMRGEELLACFLQAVTDPSQKSGSDE